jgi:hypothetical protein
VSEVARFAQTSKAVMPSNGRILTVSALIGPAVFASLFCLNSAILVYFFDQRTDRPVHEYVFVLTIGEIIFFIWSFLRSWPAFVALGAWLVISAKVLQRAAMQRCGLAISAFIFIPVMTFISCKLFGRFELYSDSDTPPLLVFGAALLWEFPLRGFFVVALPNVVTVAVCCWLLMRSRLNGDHASLVESTGA